MQYNITTRKKDRGIQYIIQYKDNSGMWKQKSKQGFAKVGDAKAAALEEVKNLEKEIQQKSSLNKEYEGKTFKDFSDMYIDHITLHKEGNTVKGYIAAFNAFSGLYDKKMADIDPADIQKRVDKMIKSGLSSTTIKQYLARMRTAFNYSIKPLRMIISSPIVDIEVAKQKSKPDKRALTQRELEDLLLKIKKEKNQLISLLAAKCGLRIGEIVGLTWDDIDNKKCIINVRQQWKTKSNGGDGFNYDYGELKSKNSTRKVPIPPDVMNALKLYNNRNPINYDNRIFCIKNTATICNTLLYIYKKAGYDISVHELRHTYATTLIANGVDFKTAAYLMGHDVKQTLETYSHVTEDMIKNATNLINKIL